MIPFRQRSLAFALFAMAGCAGAKVDVAPLAEEVRLLRSEAREMAAGDTTATAYHARSGALETEAASHQASGKNDLAQASYLEALSAARASIEAGVANRRNIEAESCVQSQADARRDWQDALHQLEQMEKASGREARGVRRSVEEPAAATPLPTMPAAPIDSLLATTAIRGSAGAWKTEAARLGAPSADLEAGWKAGLATVEGTDPEIQSSRLRAAQWDVVALAHRVRAESAIARCREAERSAALFAAERDPILWAMVELERGMKESARAALEEEMQRMEDRQQKLFDSLKQFEGKFASIRREARGTIMSLSDILFDFDKASLRREAEINLAKVAVILSQYPEMKIQIEGHTDNVGKEAYNQKLSERRAASVKTFLAENGVPEGGMETFGYGMSQPLASNANEEGRQKNRRVDLVIREQ